MNIEDKIKTLEKLERKKKWEDVSDTAVEIAEYYFEQKMDYPQSLKFLEQAITARQKQKKAETVIVLYRKIITVARKGRRKTKKDLFRYSAAAIPLIEEYIRVLQESNRYITKHGAITRYFLGECREIVSGIQERNKEFLKAGRVFVEVGKNLSSSKKTERESEEAFEKSRAIFEIMKTYKDEIFESLLVEAEINIRKYHLERGFYLFEEARGLFDDEKHQIKVADIEKVVYAEMGVQLLKKHFTDEKQREIADTLLTKSKEAHLYSKTLDEFSKIQFEIGKIDIENDQLESAFHHLDEAIQNAQLVNNEAIPREIVEYLFFEGKTRTENILKSQVKLQLENLDLLPPMIFFNKIEEIGKKLDMGHEVEEIAMFIWQFGLQLLENRAISDDIPFVEKSVEFLIRNNRLNGLNKIGEELEKRIDDYAEKMDISKFEWLRIFLVSSYREVNDNRAAGWLNVKIARKYAQWGNFEEQLACLHQAGFLFQNTDPETLRGFSESLTEHLGVANSKAFPESMYEELMGLLGNTYLQLKDMDKFDSLYSQRALKALEENDYSKALSYHKQNFAFLKTRNSPRALVRVKEFSDHFLLKDKIDLAVNIRSEQIKLLIETESSQEQILETITSLEGIISKVLDLKADLGLVEKLFKYITDLYDYLGLKEAQGDTAFEISNHLFESGYYSEGFKFLYKAFDIFRMETEIGKIGLLLDFASDKKTYFEDLEDQETAVKFSEFQIKSLKELGQFIEASELMINHAVQLIPLDENKAYNQYNEAKKILIESGLTDEVVKLNQEFGSALLKSGKIEKGMNILAEAESSSETSSLTIADTCLTVAKDRFTEGDYDTYFILIDRALSIYSDLEMFRESSSIALTEARKLWSVNDIPYTMIFLERAWAPLSTTYDEKLSESIQPLLEVTDEFIDGLFELKKFDEAVSFIEFQERIYKQLNRTDKIIEVERRKIDALIGRGNIEMALSKVYDIASMSIEESQFIETVSLLKDLLPIFFVNAPLDAKDVLKMFISLLTSVVKEETEKIVNEVSESYIEAEKIVYEVVESYIALSVDSLQTQNIELYENQVKLLFSALTEVAEAENVLIYFINRLTQELIKLENYSILFKMLKEHLGIITSLKSKIKLELMQEISALLIQSTLNEEIILTGLDILNILSKDLEEQDKEISSGLFFMIGKKHRNENESHNKAIELAFLQSEEMNSITTTLNLQYGLVEEELETEDYLNALKRFDEVIEKLGIVENPQLLARKFIELLDRTLITLAKQKKKNWMDLLSTKHRIISEKFLGEKKGVTEADEQFSEGLLDEMLDLTKNKDRKE
ncbi:MAG: hypothetical protein ACFE9L_10915 [Candidatus Hodarchaeota archaeon]